MVSRCLCLALLIVAVLGSIPGLAQSTESEAPVYMVVATHAVLGEIAERVGGDAIEVVVLIPSGFCPSHYDLAPSDYRALLDAQLVLYSGMEPWVEELGARANPDALVQMPGIWNTPPAAAEKTRQVAELLSERIPELEAQFTSNGNAFASELVAMGDHLLERAVSAGVAGCPVVCMQWQASFAAWLGLDVAITYGIPSTLTLRDLVSLAGAGREAGARVVIDNLQSGVEFGGKLSGEIGAAHAVLTNFPGAMPRTATLIDLLVRNAEALFSAVEPLE